MGRNKAHEWNWVASPLNWEEMPGHDSLGTVDRSWYASTGRYGCRIDRFTQEAGGGYAYTIECDGHPLRGAENEPAFAWESAHDIIMALLRREGAL